MPRPVACLLCGEPLEQNLQGSPRRYCPPPKTCRARAADRRRRAKARVARQAAAELDPALGGTVHDPAIAAVIDDLKGSPEPRLYEAYKHWSLLGEHVNGRLTHEDAAKVFGVDPKTVARWMSLYRQEIVKRDAEKRWKPDLTTSTLLEPSTGNFIEFYQWLFPAVDIAPFHRRWADALVRAYTEGRRIAIQGPQRFGKTQMLAAFIVWLILADPDIRILFVGRTATEAERTTGLVMQLLGGHEGLKERFLPPGGSFQPNTRSTGLSWTSAEFTVATRTKVLRSPTLAAVGAGGTILGRDADFIVCDDLVDQRNGASGMQREGLREWFGKDMTSRKEEHTGWAYIGSQQHPEDLLHTLKQDPQWEVQVYSAHDPGCGKELWVSDPKDPSEPANPRDHVSCVLWPKVRSYRWLFQSRMSAADKQTWDMNMLGVTPEGMVNRFPREMVEAARDWDLRAGQPDPSWRLVAGLDPGGGGKRGFMSAVLWGVTDDNHRWLVDAKEVAGGGVAAMRDVMHEWWTCYRLTLWVVEMNLADAYIHDDYEINNMRSQWGLQIVEHRTFHQKLDTLIGVPSLREHLEAGRWHLPYGDERSRRITDELTQQMVRWEGRPVRLQDSRTYRYDMLMAAWFPEDLIRSWQASSTVETNVEYDESWSDGYDLVGAW